MKRILVIMLLVVMTFGIAGCDETSTDDDTGKNVDPPVVDDDTDDDVVEPTRTKIDITDQCGISTVGDFVVIDGECFLIKDRVSDRVTINGETTRIEYVDTPEVMNDFVADIVGSAGLGIVPRETYEQHNDLNNNATIDDLIQLSATTVTDENTENVIVKLTEDGFFEEVSFSDANGQNIDITSNPIALEVFGDFTIVVFEVNLGYYDEDEDISFDTKVWDSLHAGGTYLMHNESGKMFPTKIIEYDEKTRVEKIDNSRDVTLEVTLNEPVLETVSQQVLDDNGDPVLDESGNPTYQEVEIPVLDDNGDPLIFTEGPVLTETKQIPLVEYYEVERLDEDGNSVLDENGNPIYDIEQVAVLDSNGDPIYTEEEFPVFDEDGNVMYQQTFDATVYIKDITQVIVTEMYGEAVDGPLTSITEILTNKLLSSYYNWNYYRQSDNAISNHEITVDEDLIYYVEYKENPSDESIQDRYVMTLSFDNETNELVLSELFNATAAGFDTCELLLNPVYDNVACLTGQDNIKLFSLEQGLKTVPDTIDFNPVTFPGGELYFVDMAYYFDDTATTIEIYSIDSLGQLIPQIIELSENDRICEYNGCQSVATIDMFIDDNSTEPYSSQHYDFDFEIGAPYYEHVDLILNGVENVESERRECTDSNGCYYMIDVYIYDTDGTTLLDILERHETIYPGDPAIPFTETYILDDSATYGYSVKYVEENKICENQEYGCQDNFRVVDDTLNNNQLTLYDNRIIDDGDTFIHSFTIDENSAATYTYEKFVTGETCALTECHEDVVVKFYDINGALLSEAREYKTYTNGQTIPLYIEYTMSENTTTSMVVDECSNLNGCIFEYSVHVNLMYEIEYEYGAQMYDNITFDSTDREEILSETINSETCLQQNGCSFDEIEYIVTDISGNELYHITSSAWVDYGYKLPFIVTVEIGSTEIAYETVSNLIDLICEEETCYSDVDVFMEESNGSTEIGRGRFTFTQGEKIINHIILPSDTTPDAVGNELICGNINGCMDNYYTRNITIYDEDGNIIVENDDEGNYLPIHFKYGELMPTNDHFSASFTIKNKVIEQEILRFDQFMHNFNQMIVLDETTYLIQVNSYGGFRYNVIITFDEITGHFRAYQTNLRTTDEVTAFNGGYVAINTDKTAIYQYILNPELSDENTYHYDISNLTEGYEINAVNELIIDYDGTIYFKGVDNFVQNITGTILANGDILIDTEYTEPEIVRIRPIN